MGKLEHLFLAALFVSGLLLFGCSSGSNGFQITTDSLPNATINVAYSQTLTASGGAAPYTWTIISGMLPTGLTLISSTGVISGTPTSNGTYPFTVKATDATNATATKPLSITVGNSGSGALQITTTSLPAGTVGNSYNGSVQATGGNTPYTWSIISGALPAGLQLDSSNGAITGTPTASGTANFTVQVQDSNSATDSKALSITVNSSSGGSVPTNGSGGPMGNHAFTYNSRDYALHVPTTYSSSTPTPIVVAMHGYGDDYVNFFNVCGAAGWLSVADNNNFIFMVPETKNPSRASFLYFSGSSFDAASTRAEMDDLLDCIYYGVGADYNIETTEIYWIGFSEGAVFTVYAAYVHSQELHAAASYAGAITGLSLPATRLIPMYFICGTADSGYQGAVDTYNAWTNAGHPTNHSWVNGVGHSFLDLNSYGPSPASVYQWLSTVACQPVVSGYH